jgi:hypothetical protein
MTIEDLKQALVSAGYDLNGIHFGEAPSVQADRWCVAHVGSLWEVYYFEKGKRQSECWFSHEADACSYLLRALVRGRTP